MLADGAIRKQTQSFYIKPIFEQYQSLVSVQGDGFSAPQSDLARKRDWGIRIGYQWGPYELETGVSFIRPLAGYRYLVPGSFGYSTQTISTDYHQFPLVFRYRFWQPAKQLSLHAGAGAAYNVNLDRSIRPPGDRFEEGTVDADGNKVILARFSRQYDQIKSFFSAEVNASARWTFSSRFSASLEFKRLISANNVINLTATQETFNPPALKTVQAHGGANSYNVNLGIKYQFGFRNRYSLMPKGD
ncbi:hypothetical protein GCM10027085_48490 [Spirosoma aerophilum]